VELADERHIRFGWSASGVPTSVGIDVLPDGSESTVVKITESEWPMDHDGVARAMEQTAGWTDFLCSLKAYVVHGVNLRAGRTASSH
jgi:hypothetical protein